jgi:DNA polymerase-3 subunit beta
MQLTIERDRLLDAAVAVASIVDARADIPVYANLRLDACANTLFVRGLGSDMEITMPAPAEVARQGVTTLNAKLLTEIVRKSPKEAMIAIEADPGKSAATIKIGRARYQLPTLPADDFPSFSTSYEDACAFRLAANELRRLIEPVRCAISTDETRYYLNGVLLTVDGERLAAVATDGHRLMRKTVVLPAQAHAMRPTIIPRATAAELLKFLPDSDVEIELSVAATSIRVELGEAELRSKVIDGTFPDYQRVIPPLGTSPAVIGRAELLRAVERVAVVLDEKQHAVTLRLAADSVTVSARGTIGGAAGRDVVESCSYEGGAVVVGANSRYLLDLLNASKSAQLAISAGDGQGPMRVEEVDVDGSLTMVLMPVRMDVDGAEMAEAA